MHLEIPRNVNIKALFILSINYLKYKLVISLKNLKEIKKDRFEYIEGLGIIDNKRG